MKTQRITKLSRLHPQGTMNVCMKSNCSSCNSCRAFQSGPNGEQTDRHCCLNKFLGHTLQRAESLTNKILFLSFFLALTHTLPSTLPDVSTRRAACPSSSWRATWWSSSLTPLRSLCLESAPIWLVLPLSLKAPVASPFSQSSASSAHCLMPSTRLHRGWKVEVSQTAYWWTDLRRFNRFLKCI